GPPRTSAAVCVPLSRSVSGTPPDAASAARWAHVDRRRDTAPGADQPAVRRLPAVSARRWCGAAALAAALACGGPPTSAGNAVDISGEWTYLDTLASSALQLSCKDQGTLQISQSGGSDVHGLGHL